MAGPPRPTPPLPVSYTYLYSYTAAIQYTSSTASLCASPMPHREAFSAAAQPVDHGGAMPHRAAFTISAVESRQLNLVGERLEHSHDTNFLSASGRYCTAWYSAWLRFGFAQRLRYRSATSPYVPDPFSLVTWQTECRCLATEPWAVRHVAPKGEPDPVDSLPHRRFASCASFSFQSIPDARQGAVH